jgi:hypothetical protein
MSIIMPLSTFRTPGKKTLHDWRKANDAVAEVMENDSEKFSRATHKKFVKRDN